MGVVGEEKERAVWYRSGAGAGAGRWSWAGSMAVRRGVSGEGKKRVVAREAEMAAGARDVA
jgi:hypothetical protein